VKRHAAFSTSKLLTFNSAVQCNLSGEPYWMITSDAPDPRDILWSNMCSDYKGIQKRRAIVQFLLVIAILTWGAFVSLVTNAANASFDNISKTDPFHNTNQDSALTAVLRAYVPALIISLILLWMPTFLFFFAMRVIKYKSFSEVWFFVSFHCRTLSMRSHLVCVCFPQRQCDEFVIKWSTAFRLTNIFFIFFSISLIQGKFHCRRIGFSVDTALNILLRHSYSMLQR
jgi:hypothetical protein